jgi:hypothetical protein
MSEVIWRVSLASAALLLAARVAGGQSVAEYRARAESLAKIWRPLAAEETKRQGARVAELPPESLRVGNLIVRADSQVIGLARSAAERLAPLVEHAYGRSSVRLLAHPLVLVATDNRQIATVITSIADSTGRQVIRSSVYPTTESVFNSWANKVEQVMFDTLSAPVREWVGGAIPVEPPASRDWNDARISLLLSGSTASRECADGKLALCSRALGVDASSNPAFELYNANERVQMIRSFDQILRKADPRQYERCTQNGATAACDSLAELIPPDAVLLPAPASARESLVRFALQQGGPGAFDRFVAASSPRTRIEAAAQMPADSVVAKWYAVISNARTASTAIDLTTALSSLLWAAACGALALRSSRWR